MRTDLLRLPSRPAVRTILLLLGLALVIRLGVVGIATRVGSDDGLGDVGYHAQLIDDPIGHLRGDLPDVEQYAPLVGAAEWVTAEPWLALGASDATSQRLGSVTWDLLGMAILLFGLARVLPSGVLFAGLVWAASPLVWPASAVAAQDETIAAAIAAVAVTLLLLRWRNAALVVLVAGLFVAKVLLAPLILAVLLTAPREARARAWATVAGSLAAAATLMWALSSTDGLSQQLGYRASDIGFSITPWSTIVLHDNITSRTAIRWSVAFALVAVAATLWVWWRRRSDGEQGAYRLAAAMFFACFAVLAVSNPEYLCIAAPVAIVACLQIDGIAVPWRLLVATTLAWAVNVAYHALPKVYSPSGAVVYAGVEGDVSGRDRLVDVVHQGLVAATCLALLVTAWHWAANRARPEPSPEDRDAIVIPLRG